MPFLSQQNLRWWCARATRLQTLAEAGDRRALMALKALEHLDDCISGTQLGITLASLALGWIGEATLSGLFVAYFCWLTSPVCGAGNAYGGGR